MSCWIDEVSQSGAGLGELGRLRGSMSSFFCCRSHSFDPCLVVERRQLASVTLRGLTSDDSSQFGERALSVCV